MIRSSAYYDKRDDYFIVEFSGDPVLALPDDEAEMPQSWTMLTHGIMTAVIDRHLRFHKIAIVGRQIAEPTESILSERLEKAADSLRHMGEQPEAQAGPAARQCLAAAEILRQERTKLIAALLASHRRETVLE